MSIIQDFKSLVESQEDNVKWTINQMIGLLKESVLVQGAITLVVIGTVSYLVLMGKPVPEDYNRIFWIIIGFYFGAKTAQWQLKSQIDALRMQVKK